MAILNSPYISMTDMNLKEELLKWEQHIETATGWPSAYFAAKQIAEIVAEGNKRGLGLVNNYPIKRG